ncbi:MAG: hypothetical protein NUV74_05220 [Candidatus Brocadiaceae bacterium]|nr:hypothetical protein [Candidatus Brocadiaceae bacterium]
MNRICIIGSAALDFERSSVAVIGRGAKPVIEGALCSVRQKSPTKFRLAGQFNRVPPNTGFFASIAAVLHAIATSLNRLLGKKDRLVYAPHSKPRSVGQATAQPYSSKAAERTVSDELPVTRTWFLQYISKDGEGRHWLFLCPFGELSPE